MKKNKCLPSEFFHIYTNQSLESALREDLRICKCLNRTICPLQIQHCTNTDLYKWILELIWCQCAQQILLCWLQFKVLHCAITSVRAPAMKWPSVLNCRGDLASFFFFFVSPALVMHGTKRDFCPNSNQRHDSFLRKDRGHHFINSMSRKNFSGASRCVLQFIVPPLIQVTSSIVGFKLTPHLNLIRLPKLAWNQCNVSSACQKFLF